VQQRFLESFFFDTLKHTKMATHYTAEQYDQEFNPKRLQMYEIAKPCLSKVLMIEKEANQ